MSTITSSIPVYRVTAPTFAERALLQASRRLESVAVARMERRAVTANPITEKARTAADERRRTAQALGSFGILPQ